MGRFAPLIAGVVACAALVFTPFARSNPVVIWNASPSIPMGLYVIERRPPSRSEVAVLRLPKWASNIADQRQYLPTTALLLKPVAAAKDDIVCRFGRHVFVNGELRATALTQDRLGRPLPSWMGCLKPQGGQIFVLSKRKDSFDSRYFGVVDQRQVLGTGRLIFSTQ